MYITSNTLFVRCSKCGKLTEVSDLYLEDTTKCSCGHHHGESYKIEVEETCDYCGYKIKVAWKG